MQHALKSALHATAAGKFRLEVLSPSGRVVRRSKWQKNLVTNRLLDGLAVRTWADSMKYCAVGTGTTPMHVASGTTVADRVGTTVTADGSIFDASYVGSIIKWETGEEETIASYTSPTVVETSGSGAIASGTFTIHRVNLQGHTAESKRSNTYVSGASNCGASYDGTLKTNTIFLTYIFSAEAGAVTYNEIGLSDSGTVGSNLNARAIISGGVSLAPGQQLRVKYTLTITLTNDSAQTAEVLPITGIADQNATQQVYLRGIEGFTSSGATSLSHTANALEPSEAKQIYAAQNPPGSGGGGFASAGGGFAGRVELYNYNGGVTLSKAANAAAYVSGSYQRDFSVTFTTAEVNTTIEWIGFSSTSNYAAILQQMDTPFAKTSDDTLALTYRLSWGRELVN